MLTEELNEKIEVAIEHKAGKLTPVRFAWKGRNYNVSMVYANWKEKSPSNTIEHHFSVSTGGPDMYELIFNGIDLSWRLGRVMLEG